MERLTWKEIEAKYPNSWIVMDNVKFDGGDICEADVIDVLTDDTISNYRVSHIDKKYVYDRTNPEELGGLITVEGIESKLK
jgi:hypothetical protein